MKSEIEISLCPRRNLFIFQVCTPILDVSSIPRIKNEGGVSGRIKKELNLVGKASDVRNLEQLIIRGKRKDLKNETCGLENDHAHPEAGRSAILEYVPEI